jgi:thymidylate synthase (FAD)
MSKINYEKEIKILECDAPYKDVDGNIVRISGFVRYVDHMGDDSAIVQAARVSYGAGTKTVNDDRNLIRYLLRHFHTTPFEMCELKLHIKVPLFVSAQSIRHRTFSVNQYSGRYSEMSSDMYIPELGQLKKQSSSNKQGGGELLDEQNRNGVQWLLKAANEHSLNIYKVLLGCDSDDKDSVREYKAICEQVYEPFTDISGEGSLLNEDYKKNALSRELARTVLPVSNFTEFYMKGNLLNWMKFVQLRSDSHAQWEIQQMSNAVWEILKELFPVAMEAFNDYMYQSVRFSRMEMELTKRILDKCEVDIPHIVNHSIDDIIKDYGMSKREINEFIGKW